MTESICTSLLFDSLFTYIFNVLCHKSWNRPKLYIQLCIQASFVCLHCSNKVFLLFKTCFLYVDYNNIASAASLVVKFNTIVAGGKGGIVQVLSSLHFVSQLLFSTVYCSPAWAFSCSWALLFLNVGSVVKSASIRYCDGVSCIDTWCNLSVCNLVPALLVWTQNKNKLWPVPSVCQFHLMLCLCCSDTGPHAGPRWSTSAAFFFFFIRLFYLDHRALKPHSFYDSAVHDNETLWLTARKYVKICILYVRRMFYSSSWFSANRR